MTEQSLYITSFSEISSVIENDQGGKILVLKSKPKKIKTGYKCIDQAPHLVETHYRSLVFKYSVSVCASFTYELRKIVEEIDGSGQSLLLICEIKGGFMLQGINSNLERVSVYVAGGYSYGRVECEFKTLSGATALIIDTFQVATN